MKQLGPEHYESLIVAMLIAPGVYSRNRKFDLLSKDFARRAAARASWLRAIAGQLRHVQQLFITPLVQRDDGTPTHVNLRYALASLRVERSIEMTMVEVSALGLVLERLGISELLGASFDRRLAVEALARLHPGGAGLEPLTRGQT